MLHYDKNGNVIDDEELGSAGIAYWHAFLKCHKHILSTSKDRLFELNRTNWTLYSNFCDMYINVEKHMVNANIAEPMEEPCWMNKDGESVSVSESESFHSTYPTSLLFNYG
jgi:hypothetical protein